MKNFVYIYADVSKFYDDPMSIPIHICYLCFNIFQMRGQLFSKSYSKTGSTEEAKINPFYHNFLLIASEKVFTSSFLKKVGSMIFLVLETTQLVVCLCQISQLHDVYFQKYIGRGSFYLLTPTPIHPTSIKIPFKIGLNFFHFADMTCYPVKELRVLLFMDMKLIKVFSLNFFKVADIKFAQVSQLKVSQLMEKRFCKVLARLLPFRTHEISQSSPVKHFHFVHMKYRRALQKDFSPLWTSNIVEFSSKSFPCRRHEIPQSSPAKLFHFVIMKYCRVLQLKFSISWT